LFSNKFHSFFKSAGHEKQRLFYHEFVFWHPGTFFDRMVCGFYPNALTTTLLSDYATSWGANDGGIQKTHIPHDMLNMYVRSDGVCVTATN